ncbi:MAG TPA: hypothetical protein VHM28_04495, partial [Anaerolineales bacterium]|nr:hypothetical protein [Anaerolineales bacterium]
PLVEEPASVEELKAKPPRRKTTVKKSGTKTIKPSASGADSKADVKKKIMESVKSRKPHVKRVSLRHNL